VHDVLAANLESLQSIFRAYAASSLEGSANDMDMEEFHDFVIDSKLLTESYGFEVITGSFTKANAGSNDKVLEFHEFITMLVRISFYRANPHYGLQKGMDGKRVGQSTALSEAALERQAGKSDEFAEDETPLPGCLVNMINNLVLPNARNDTHASEFVEKTLPLPEVEQALGGQHEQMQTFYEMVSAGRPFLEIDQWLGALEGKLLFSDLTIEGYSVRLTESQAKAAFYASAATPASGLLPDELPVCIARIACDKYRHVDPMGPGAKVSGLLQNLLTEFDEEDVVFEAIGHAPVEGKHAKPAGPRYSADGMLLGEEEERITGVASGTGAMLMPDERSMAEREKFETKGYNPSRDSIDMSAGATLAAESSGLHEVKEE
jgi:hypothetical protein